MTSLNNDILPLRSAGNPKGAPCYATVWCRRPGETPFELRQHSPVRTFDSISRLPDTGGFVIAPFESNATCPLLLVEPDEFRSADPLTGDTEALTHIQWGTPDEKAQRLSYASAFSAAHGRLVRGEVEKIVLSRRLHLPFASEATDATSDEIARLGHALFLRACAAYPECFVALWHIPGHGTWVTATPEPLLRNRGSLWHTVALAGTQPADAGSWSTKNREEQAIVARFVARALDTVATDINQSAPYAFTTGRIQHLRTDFTFGLPDTAAALSLLQQLHPTPAVCGTPRGLAREAILAAEPEPRKYYAGFCGPYRLGQWGTSLFVTLRCAELSSEGITFYAGGGLLAESNEADEWNETCRKIHTLRSLVAPDAHAAH